MNTKTDSSVSQQKQTRKTSHLNLDVSHSTKPDEVGMKSSGGAREGDNMIGRSLQVAVNVQKASDEQLKQVEKEDHVNAQELLESLKTSRRTALAESSIVLLLVFLSALILFYILKAFADAWLVFLTLPVWASWIFSTLMGISGAVVIICLLRFWYRFGRLRPPGKTFSREKLFSGRAMQGDKDDELRIVRVYLRTEFLEEYRNNFGLIKTMLLNEWNEKEEVVQQLENSIDRLLAPETYSSTSHRNWVERFDSEFIKPMYVIADKRCKSLAKLAAIKSAISPWSVLDMFMVLGNSVVLTGDMLRLFNRKTSPGCSFRLLFHILLQTYIASEAQERLETAFDGLRESIEGEAAELVGKAAAKTAEGYLNGRMVYRLGMKAFQYVSPLGNG
jgi:uncharacterized membrane protein YcjF (UPF0283 family)